MTRSRSMFQLPGIPALLLGALLALESPAACRPVERVSTSTSSTRTPSTARASSPAADAQHAAPQPADAELDALERDAEREIALAARGATLDAALAKVREIAVLARRRAALPPAELGAERRISGWAALARCAGPLATLGDTSAAELRDEALDALVKHHADDAALLAFLERFGRGNALAIGVKPSEKFLDRLASATKDPASSSVCRAARALAQFEAIDSLGRERIGEMRAALARVRVDLPGTRWARRADAALFHWEHLRVLSVAPELTGVDDAGKRVKLRELRGRVVVLDFWRSDSARWRAGLEAQRGWVKLYAGRPLTLLGVNADDDPAEATRWTADERAQLARLGRPDDAELARLSESERAFCARVRAADVARVHAAAQELALPWPSIVDGEAEGLWTSRWNVVEWPALVVIDAQGKIRYRNLPPDELALTLAMLVQEAEAAVRGEKR